MYLIGYRQGIETKLGNQRIKYVVTFDGVEVAFFAVMSDAQEFTNNAI